jgi:hypothetical protein
MRYSLNSYASRTAFAAILLAIGLCYSCQKEPFRQPLAENPSLASEVNCRSCVPFDINTGFPTPTTSTSSTSPYYQSTGKLYKARIYVAFYRLYLNLRPYYTGSSNQIDQNELVNFSGITGNLPNLTLVNGAFSSAFAKSSYWDRVTEFCTKCYNTFQNSDKNYVYDASKNNWDASQTSTVDTVGSYTIIFTNAPSKTYSGKGKKARARDSADARCAQNGMDNPVVADQEPAYKTGLRPSNVSIDRQAFKEEAVRMFAMGGTGSSTYNINASPGVNYIINDTY